MATSIDSCTPSGAFCPASSTNPAALSRPRPLAGSGGLGWLGRRVTRGAVLLLLGCNLTDPQPVESFALVRFGPSPLPVNRVTDVSADGTERGFQIVGGRLLLFGDRRFVRELHTRSTRNGVPSGGRRVARIVGTWQDEAGILRLSHAPTTDPGRLHAWQYQREGGGAVLKGEENHYFNSLAVYVAMVEYQRDR